MFCSLRNSLIRSLSSVAIASSNSSFRLTFSDSNDIFKFTIYPLPPLLKIFLQNAGRCKLFVKQHAMILPCLFIAPSEGKGKGIFTSEHLEKDTVIEIAPVIVMGKDERKLLDQTRLH